MTGSRKLSDHLGTIEAGVAMMEVAVLLVSRYCTGCAADSRFEVLGDCAEHGVDCPEIICVECGAVYLCGPWAEVDLVDGAGRAATRSTSAA